MVQILLCCIYVLLFVYIIRKNAFYNLPGISSNQAVMLFLLKVLVGTFVWKFFVSYYPVSDANQYFEESKILYDLFFQDPVQFFKLFSGQATANLSAIQEKMIIWNNNSGSFLINNHRTMIRLNTLFRFFSMGHFYVHAIITCFISYSGLTCLYKLFYPYMRSRAYLLVIALFLFPSVLFWSSTVLKEGIIFFGLGLLLYHCQLGLRNRYSLMNVLGVVAGAFIVMVIKIYILMALFPALLANSWIANSSHKYIVLKYTGTYLFFAAVLFIVPYKSPALDFVKVIKTKQTDFINSARGGVLLSHDSVRVFMEFDQYTEHLEPVGTNMYRLKKGFTYLSYKQGNTDTLMIDGAADSSIFKLKSAVAPATSKFTIPRMQPTVLGILKNAPVAFFNTLVIPSLVHLDKTFAGFIMIENALLLLFIICIVLFFSRKTIPLAVTLFCFSFVILLFSLIGFTTPITGALVRYRIPGIPFLIIGFCLILDEKKVNRFISYLKTS
ncbi:MAG TPA: hypothetical protein VLB84_16450 [Bacteroidia bacterium]|nr:hypothetical protein [Bacteroidia bacterium]